MLEQLHVKNYALIDSLEIQFSRGFNVLTGETGAGKSILIGSVGLLLGQKGDIGVIREGSDTLEVSGTIRIEKPGEILPWLETREIPLEDSRLILRRVMKTNGRSSCFIQGVPVTRGDLEELTSGLIDLHGQHEHQSLLSVEKHRKLLDRFGGSEELDREVYEKFVQLTSLRKEFEELNTRERERYREMELLAFAADEIEKARLLPGEEEELERERALLGQSEKLFRSLAAFLEVSDGDEGSLRRILGSARDELGRIAGIDESMQGLFSRLESAFYEIEDIVQGVKDYHNSVDFSPERLEFCESRLAEIHHLEKKYGNSIEDVLFYGKTALEKLDSLQNWESLQEKLKKDITLLEQEIREKAAELSKIRKTASLALGTAVKQRLTKLGMEKARFEVAMETRLGTQGTPSCGSHGWDKVEFLISANPGEPLKPLRNIASGGEISRVMLALKSVLAETDDIQSLIFDEVDAGIGGEVALSVAEHLAGIARHKQVLCITHLASIAVRADNHMKVEKEVRGSRTLTSIRQVTGEERSVEISRMLSGDSRGEVSLIHARELLEKYRSEGF